MLAANVADGAFSHGHGNKERIQVGCVVRDEQIRTGHRHRLRLQTVFAGAKRVDVRIQRFPDSPVADFFTHGMGLLSLTDNRQLF